jgi:hypothetical protein
VGGWGGGLYCVRERSRNAEISLDNFVKALEEEANAAATFFGDNDATQTGALRPVASVVEELRKGAGINWALFTTDGKGVSSPATTPSAAAAAAAATPLTTTTPTAFPATVPLSKPLLPASSAASTAPLAAVKPVTGKLASGSWMKPTGDSSDTTTPANTTSTKSTLPTPAAVGKISVAASAMFGGARKSVDSVSASPLAPQIVVPEVVVPAATVPDAAVAVADATVPEPAVSVATDAVVVAAAAVPEPVVAAATVTDAESKVSEDVKEVPAPAAQVVVAEVVVDVKSEEIKTEEEKVIAAESENIPKQTVAEE